MSWNADALYVNPSSYTLSAYEDVVLEFDTTALLIAAGAPSVPVSYLHTVQYGTFETLQDTPTITGNTIRQRIRGLTAGTDYELHVTFATSGNRRDMKVRLECVQ